MDKNKSIGNLLKSYRLKNKDSVKQCAKKMGIKEITVYKYESSEILPSAKIIALYVYHYKANADQIIKSIFK